MQHQHHSRQQQQQQQHIYIDLRSRRAIAPLAMISALASTRTDVSHFLLCDLLLRLPSLICELPVVLRALKLVP
jgi:hypothetical protein